ncbi:MAG: hypothetical protein JWO03_506 [Bacteroidetes bacterium]|nr:hypothetical protein [Bacteroidota bacterium]
MNPEHKEQLDKLKKAFETKQSRSVEENLDFLLGILYLRRTVPDLDQIGMQMMISLMIDGMYKDDSAKTMLLDRLRLNGNINVINNKDVHISEKGVLFLLEEGGYTKKRKFQLIDEEIKAKTLKKFRWDRVAVILSLAALAVSIAVAYHKW